MSKAVVPISGGLDSSVILSIASAYYDKVYTISYDYGQKHKKELLYAEMQIDCYDNIEHHNRVDLSFFKNIATSSSITNNNIPVAHAKDVLGDAQTVNYVPFRNMMMLSIACSYAEAVGAETVYHGAALVDSQAGYWDGSKEFLKCINDVTALNRKNRIEIKAPLIEFSKADIIKFLQGPMYGGVEDRDIEDMWPWLLEALQEASRYSRELRGHAKQIFLKTLEKIKKERIRGDKDQAAAVDDIEGAHLLNGHDKRTIIRALQYEGYSLDLQGTGDIGTSKPVTEKVKVDRRTKGFKEAMMRKEKAKLKREKAKIKKEKKAEKEVLDARYEYDGSVNTVLAAANAVLFGKKLPEDAAANSVADGGVDMAPNAGKKKKKETIVRRGY